MGRTQEILSRIREETGGLRPHYERYSILSVPGTVMEVLGIEPDGPSLKGELGLPEAEKVVSIVVDGLGYLKLEELRERGVVDLGPFPSDGAYLPLTSVFPPTTTTALTTLSTGVSPIRHGVLGYKLFLQEVGAVVNMIKLAAPGAPEDSLEDLGVDLDSFLPVPTVYQRLREAGVTPFLLLPKYLVDSGLSHALYRGVEEIVPFVNLSDLFMLVRQLLEGKGGRSFLSIYWPATDTLAHLYGPDSPAFALEVAMFFRLLQGELLERVRGAVVLLTSDHGFTEIDPQNDVIDCTAEPVLKRSLVLPPVGDSRAAYLYLLRGREEEVSRFLAERYPGEFMVLPVEEALERGIWGPEEPTAAARMRLGDLLAAALGRKLLFWPQGEEFRLRGMHGGLTERELLVPLLALSL